MGAFESAQCANDAVLAAVNSGLRGLSSSGVVNRQVVIAVQAAHVLTADRAQEVLGPSIVDRLTAYCLGSNDHVLLALALLMAAGADGEGAEELAAARQWTSYAGTLPTLDELSGLLSEWSPTQLHRLADPAGLAASAHRQEEALRATFECVQEAVSAPDSAAAMALRNMLTWQSFRWASAAVTSRAFLCGIEETRQAALDMFGQAQADFGRLALVPLVDMLNHDGMGRKATLDVTWDDGCRVIARRAYEPGEALLLSYGDRTGCDLLETYGFILPLAENAAEAAVLPLPLPQEPAVLDGSVGLQRSSWLGSIGPIETVELAAGPMHSLLSATTPGPCASAVHRVSSDTVALLRALSVDQEDLRSLAAEAAAESAGPVSADGSRPFLVGEGVVRLGGGPNKSGAPSALVPAERLLRALSPSNEARAANLLLQMISKAVAPMEEVYDLSCEGGDAADELALRLAAVLHAAAADAEGANAVLRTLPSATPLPALGRPWAALAPGLWSEAEYATAASPARAAMAATHVYNRAACLLAHLALIALAGKAAAAGGSASLSSPRDITAFVRRVLGDPRLTHAPPAHAPLPLASTTAALTAQLEGCKLLLECQEPWHELLLSGVKVIETRGYAPPPGLLGRTVLLLQSPRPGGLATHGLSAGVAVGVLRFSCVKEYRTRAQWEQDEVLHGVKADSPTPADGGFGWDGTPRYGWVVEPGSAARLAVPVPLALSEDTRLLRSIFAVSPIDLRLALWRAGERMGNDGSGPERAQMYELGALPGVAGRTLQMAFRARETVRAGVFITDRKCDRDGHDMTGCLAWTACALLGQLLAAYPAIYADKDVIELGCGTALLSAVCSGSGVRDGPALPGQAVLQSARTLIVTDGQAGVLELAGRNIAGRSLSVTLPLSWSTHPDAERRTATFEERRALAALRAAIPPSAADDPDGTAEPLFDLALASEPLYLHRSGNANSRPDWCMAAQATALLLTASRLLKPEGILLIVYSPRVRGMARDLTDAAAAAGLHSAPLPRISVLTPQQRSSHMYTDTRLVAYSASAEALDRLRQGAGDIPMAEPSESTDGAGWDDDEAEAADQASPFAGLPCGDE